MLGMGDPHLDMRVDHGSNFIRVHPAVLVLSPDKNEGKRVTDFQL